MAAWQSDKLSQALHQSPGGPTRRHGACGGRWWVSALTSLTLSGGLEVKGLEAPGQRCGVDDVHAVLAVVLPVQHDGHYEDRHGEDSSSKARVERHVVGSVHT